MTREEMIFNYEATQAAMAYIIGFILNNRVYRIVMNKLADDMFGLDRESTSHGGHAKIKLRLTNAIKCRLIEMGAQDIGTPDEIVGGSDKYNKGDRWERWNAQQAGQEWHKSRTEYYLDGDLTVGGISYQIKFEGASFTNEKVIAKAMAWKFGRA